MAVVGLISFVFIAVGAVNVVQTGLSCGAKLTMLDRFDAALIWSRFLTDDDVNLFMAVPTVYHHLIKYYDEEMNSEDRNRIPSIMKKKFRLMVAKLFLI